MKTIELQCANCECKFDRSLKEYTRRTKLGKIEFFCNNKCAAVKSNKDKPRPGNISNLQSDNRRDEYTQFRWFVNRSNWRGKRRKKLGCDLTVEYLKKLWEEQKGICPFTGWEMILPKDSAYPWDKPDPANASIDRLDNNKGYMQGNVRFICFMANIGRQNFTDEQLINFCQSVAKIYKRTL